MPSPTGERQRLVVPARLGEQTNDDDDDRCKGDCDADAVCGGVYSDRLDTSDTESAAKGGGAPVNPGQKNFLSETEATATADPLLNACDGDAMPQY